MPPRYVENVKLIFFEQGKKLRGLPDFQIDFKIGKALAKFRKNGEHLGKEQGFKNSDINTTSHALFILTDSASAVHKIQKTLGVKQKFLSLSGQLRLASDPFKQGKAELLFQTLYLHRDG